MGVMDVKRQLLNAVTQADRDYAVQLQRYERHAQSPLFVYAGLKEHNFPPEAFEFADAAELPAGIGVADGLPADWLSRFAACAAFIAELVPDRTYSARRKVPSWVPTELRDRVGETYRGTGFRWGPPGYDGSTLAIRFVNGTYVWLVEQIGTLHVCVASTETILVAAHKSRARGSKLERPTIAPMEAEGTQYEVTRTEQRVTYPHRLSAAAVAFADRWAGHLAPSLPEIGGISPRDLARWILAAQWDGRLPSVYVEMRDAPAAMRAEWRRNYEAFYAHLESVYGVDPCAASFMLSVPGHVDGQRYYHWYEYDGHREAHAVESGTELADMARAWMEDRVHVELPRAVVESRSVGGSDDSGYGEWG